MKVLSNLDLLQNELQNIVIHKSTVAPDNGVIGQIYFNTIDNKLFMYNGAEWEPIGSEVAIIGGETETSKVIVDNNEITTNIKISDEAGNGLSISPTGGLYVEYQEIELATPEEGGLMSAADKAKLDAIGDIADKTVYTEMPEANAENEGLLLIYNGIETDDLIAGHIYKCIATTDDTGIVTYTWKEMMPTILGTTSPTTEVTVVDGVITTNVLLSEEAGNGLSVDVDGGLFVEYQEIEAATGEEAGLMSAADKIKLDGMQEGADKVIYTEMPEATADNLNQFIVYNGAAAEGLVPGHTYRCVSDGENYIWEEIMPTISGSESLTTEVVVSENGVITTDVKVSENLKNGLTVDANGGLFIEYQEIIEATDTEAGLMTPEQVQKLTNIESGAQINVIEKVNVNNVELTATEKTVSLEVEAADAGIVVNTTDTGKITVGAKISTTENNALTLDDNGLFVNVPTPSEYTVVKAETAEAGFISTYNLQKDGVNVGASINIPRDFLVKSANIKEVTVENTPYDGALVGDKYIDFTINVKEGSTAEEHIYLPVNELVDVYTAGTAIDITTDNIISVKVVAGNGLKVDENGIALEAASAETAGAMSTEDFTKLSGIEEGAEVNTIEGIQFNGTDIELDENKKANLILGEATTEVAGLMSASDKANLDAAIAKHAEYDEQLTEFDTRIDANAEATALKQDKLIAGANITIDDEKTINAIIPVASADAVGGIKVGTGLSIDGNGTLSAAHKFVALIGDGAATSFTITHGLNTRDVIVQVSDANTYEVVIANIAVASENAVTVNFASVPAASAYRVIVIA